MLVRVLDHSGRGSNRRYSQVVTVEIADACPVCGSPRGRPRPYRGSGNGEPYEVDVWDNPCGHVDQYATVLNEVERRRNKT